MRQEARGAGGVQERVAAGAVGEERGWGRKRRVAPWGYPREGAGKFFPLGCRQKGNYFNCGQPRSTKLHPVFLLPLSVSVPLLLSLLVHMWDSSRWFCLFLTPRLVCYLSPPPLSLLRFVGEHIPSLAAATAGVSRLARVCLPSWKLARLPRV